MPARDERVILLVDDVEQVGSIAGDYLERRLERVRVVRMLRPQDALEWLQHNAPVDLVLSDNHMGDMDGVTFLQEARAMQPKCIRVLMTAYLDLDASPQELGAMGIHALIRKPWEWPEFARFVGELLGLPVEERARLEREGPIPFPVTAFQEFAAHRSGATAKRKPAAEEPRRLEEALQARERQETDPPVRATPGSAPDRARVCCPECAHVFEVAATPAPERSPAATPARAPAARQPPGAPLPDDEEARRILAYLRARPGVARHMRALQAPPASKPRRPSDPGSKHK